MTERQYAKRDIILELIGKRVGIGETNYDKEVLKNLDFVDEIITYILEDLVCNLTYTGYEGSMIDIKERSRKIIDRILEIAEQEN